MFICIGNDIRLPSGSLHPELVGVVSIYENTLMEIKRKSPEIVEAFARSDNAGCYHCALLLLSILGISQRTGVTTSRYDFSKSTVAKIYAITIFIL